MKLHIIHPPAIAVPPYQGYGVHTSREITPSIWFPHLAFGRAIALEACHCEEERRSNRKNHGTMRLLRSARNDNLRGL